jgi:oligopeptide/dipeptide ABC transporter ATP-binding protein
MTALLEVENLDVHFSVQDGDVHAVKGACFSIQEGECLGVVGESGSGKSQLFLAVAGLLAGNGRATGSVKYRGQEILNISQPRLNKLRGAKISMIFQDPLTALTPHMTIGAQIVESLRAHRRMPGGDARRKAIAVLEQVRISEARRRLEQYPHELSGGMRQRVMIAMAIVCGPDLLIADEPTTALDVTVQAQILDILRELRAELNTAIALVSHDMGVIAGLADRVQVMRSGAIVEQGTVERVFHAPQEDYTKMLLAAMPRLDAPPRADASPADTVGTPLLAVKDLQVHFPIRGEHLFAKKKILRAVDGVDLTITPGEALGIVGESGSGKSTLARAVLQFLPPAAGTIAWLGRDLAPQSQREIRKLRADLQIVFQDPLASLDPRMPIGESIGEPLKALMPSLRRAERLTRVRAMMDDVGLEPAWINRYPHELSGGQNQRVGIARAMIVEPKLVICDEAVSALDVSIQAQIVDLIMALQVKTGMALIFISHDLSVVRRISHRVMVLYLGRVVERAPAAALYADPRHPYTRALIAAVPVPDPRAPRPPRALLTGDVPSPLDSRSQLGFLKSRMIDDPDAVQYRPRLIEVAPDHFVAEHD